MLILIGLLIWNSLAISAMGWGMIQTQPQLARTTEYTHSMKVTTEGAINGATKFFKTRMAEYPENQMDVWVKQLSESLGSITVITKSIETSIDAALSDINGLVHTSVVAIVKELVPAENKAKISAMFNDIAAITQKMRNATDKLTADELAQGFRSISQLSRDTDDVVAAIKNAFSKNK